MRHVILALAVAATTASFAVVPAIASDKTDALATVAKWTSDFNKGDSKAFLAACAPDAVIIDEFAPFIWQGANACSVWATANDAENKRLGSTGGVLTTGKPLHVTVTGDHAYVVLPAKFADTENGKPVTQSATWTVTLHKTGTAWSISGSSWGQR
jgi:ketosteroid isomerase-like protein